MPDSGVGERYRRGAEARRDFAERRAQEANLAKVRPSFSRQAAPSFPDHSEKAGDVEKRRAASRTLSCSQGADATFLRFRGGRLLSFPRSPITSTHHHRWKARICEFFQTALSVAACPRHSTQERVGPFPRFDSCRRPYARPSRFPW